ncbi:hypothetical protein EVAR_48211_1 [Eumeta japonica]|uniref:Uncharacterized protein n=1 Tax=Eumeta variegata TaxID=151549 RepID=A0A4C1XUT0_EUMVA|nr:hypothetical protein EVAR_48211_1 [Eumeta japonica]
MRDRNGRKWHNEGGVVQWTESEPPKLSLTARKATTKAVTSHLYSTKVTEPRKEFVEFAPPREGPAGARGVSARRRRPGREGSHLAHASRRNNGPGLPLAYLSRDRQTSGGHVSIRAIVHIVVQLSTTVTHNGRTGLMVYGCRRFETLDNSSTGVQKWPTIVDRETEDVDDEVIKSEEDNLESEPNLQILIRDVEMKESRVEKSNEERSNDEDEPLDDNTPLSKLSDGKKKISLQISL